MPGFFAAIARGSGRIVKLVLLLLLLAVLSVAIPGGLAKAVQHLATPRAPDHLPTPTRPSFDNAVELLLTAVGAGAGCDAIEEIPATTVPPDTAVPTTGPDTVPGAVPADEDATGAVTEPDTPVTPGVAGSTSGITCTSGDTRIWMLVYADADQRDAAFAGATVHDELCPIANGDISAGLAGNWAYLVSGESRTTVLADAMDALHVELTPDPVVCAAPLP